MVLFALVCSSRQLVASPDAPIAALIGSLLTAVVAEPGSALDAYRRDGPEARGADGPVEQG